MYVWHLPEFLLTIAEEDVVNKLVKTRRLIQEQDIETIHSKLPGKVIKLKIDEVRPYLDEDALAALQKLVSIYLCGIYSCIFYTLFILNQVYLILSKNSAG